jgi:hypothetical protein
MLNVIVDGPFLALLLKWQRITSKERPEPVDQSTREGAQKEALKGAIGDLFVGVLGQFHGIRNGQMWHLLEDAN